MSTKFFNNTVTTLFDKFKGISSDMANFDLFHAVAGYFRASGWFKLRPLLDNVKEIKILVGLDADFLTASVYQTTMYVGEAHRDEFLNLFNQAFADDVRHAQYTAEVEQGIRQFATDLHDGRIQLRISTERNLHAKFYLCLPDPHTPNSDGWVIMGSSNLSEQGLGTTQPPRYELNVAMKDYDDVAFCEAEFQRQWEVGMEITSEDAGKAVASTHLGASERLTPYDIYMRVLIDHFGSFVENGFIPKLPKGYDDLTYQRDAAAQGYDLMLRHNGCFIADVVGLGKTVIAAMIAQQFVAANGERSRILVVFPPAVRSNWENTITDFELKDYCRFISSGSLDKVLEAEGNLLPKERYDMVIVDESHNFRNEDTTGFGYLQEICKAPRSQPGSIGGRKKILLLSATPLNNGPEDLRAQIRLFMDDRRCTIEGITDMQATFAPWIKRYKEMRMNRDTWEVDRITRVSDEINKEIRHAVLEKIMVRRTRNNIKNEPRYRDEITFPELLVPEEHSYQMSPKVASLFLETHRLLIDTPEANLKELYPSLYKSDGLHYARYRAVEYCPPYAKRSGKNPKELRNTGDQLAGIYQVHMVKRLESSFLAFKNSLHTLRDSTQGMIEMFKANKVIICPELNVKKLQAEGKEIDSIIKLALEKGFEQDQIVYRADDFHPEFIEILKHDKAILDKLCTEWDAVKDDPKLDLFVHLLKTDLFNPRKNHEGKLVVFSESVDTVEYLIKELKRRLHRNDILDVYAANRDSKKALIQENFDAKHKGIHKNDYNIIITSDVLAEGINLHRANVVVNYDSPWNATRLMQRIGRVNRVGSTADAIHNIMFYPSKQGDQIINLYKNTLIKMQSFHSALGEDTQIYSHDEIVREFKLFDPTERDETDETNVLIAEVRKLHDENPKLYRHIQQLPAKCRVARNAGHIQEGSIHDTQYTIHNFTLAYMSSSNKQAVCIVENDGKVRELTLLEAAELLKAEPDEKAAPFAKVEQLHYAQLGNALDFYRQLSDGHKVTALPTAGKLDQEANRAKKLLREIGAMSGDETVKKHAATLIALVDAGRYAQLTTAFSRIARKKERPSLAVQVDMVEDYFDRFGDSVEEATDRQQSSQEPELILSETIIG